MIKINNDTDIIGYFSKWELHSPRSAGEYNGVDVDPNSFILFKDGVSVIFPDAAVCVAFFIDNWLKIISLPSHLSYLQDDWDSNDDVKQTLENSVYNFMFYDFTSAADVHKLVEDCSKDLPNEFSRHWNFEEWLLANIGEYVFFAKNDLSVLSSLVDDFHDLFAEIDQEMFGNITCKPIGYPGTVGYFNRFKEAKKLVALSSKRSTSVFGRVSG